MNRISMYVPLNLIDQIQLLTPTRNAKIKINYQELMPIFKTKERYNRKIEII